MSDRSLPSTPSAPGLLHRVWLLLGALLLLAGCGGWLAAGDIDMLAKTRVPFHPEEDPDPVLGPAMEPGLRVATDEATARKLWDALAVDGLGPTSDPAERGRHGELDAVDFTDQVVVLWRGGESGTCPHRVDDIATTDDGVVEITLSLSLLDVVCTDDYAPYVVLAAVDRAAMPSALPARGRAVGPRDERPTTFPVVDAAEPDVLADAPAVAMAGLAPPQRAGVTALAIHPAWTVREGGVVARPGDAFELAEGLTDAELVRVDDHGDPVGQPQLVRGASGRLPEAEEVTYRLTGELDGRSAREWIRVPAVEREASVRVSTSEVDNAADARPGEALEVRVVNEGTVALGYRPEVEWQPWEPEEPEPGPGPSSGATPDRDLFEEGLVEEGPAPSPERESSRREERAANGPLADDAADERNGAEKHGEEGPVMAVEPGGESEPIPTTAPDEPGAYALVVRAGDALLADGDGDILQVQFDHRFSVH